MNKDIIYHGIRIGTHEFVPEKVIDRIKKECIKPGLNFVRFSLGGESFKIENGFDENWLYEWAEFLKDNKIYFSFEAINKFLQENKHVMYKMKEIAGEYYLCNVSKEELSTHRASIGKGYGLPESPATNMKEGKEAFQEEVRKAINIAQLGGEITNDIIPLCTVDATTMLSYVIDQGFTFSYYETCSNTEMMVATLRANANMLKHPIWGTFVAHEWYSGTRSLDALKLKRLELIYKYNYMSGSSAFILESGDECLYCHDLMEGRKLGTFNPMIESKCLYDHPACAYYRKVLKDFADLTKKDKRPAGGPKVKVAFVQGNYDGYSPWRCGSSLWNMFSKKEYGYSDPEFVWRIIDDIATKRPWTDIHNFGDVDLSGAPAYGTYDIIPATADSETLSKYDYLIFVGWNSMTDEIYENLKKYVYGGGKLFMTAAHLNTSVERNGEVKLVKDGKIADLFGCNLDVENSLNVNDGIKFLESTVPGVMYPADQQFDPLFSEGYVNYAKVEMDGGYVAGRLSQDFFDKDFEGNPVAIVENNYGAGHTILMTSFDYPNRTAYPAYRAIVRELLTSSHRAADVKIHGGDKLRFTVYEGNKIYLLNTDFDCKVEAIIDYGTEKKSFILEPLELKIVE